MELGSIAFIVVGIAVPLSFVLTTWIRVRHGYPLDNHQGSAFREQAATTARLEAENKELREQMGRALDRIAVLEQIAIDPGERTAREIESLVSRR